MDYTVFMSDFDIDKNKPVSQKIVLAELGFNITPSIWINHEAGIWCYVLTPDPPGVEDDYDIEGYYIPQNTFIYPTVKQVLVNSVKYTRCTSYASMYATDSSFFYDISTTKLYIHMAWWGHPQGKDIAVQAIYGFCNQIDPATDGYYNDIYYSPRLKEMPPVKKSKDVNFFGVLQFNDGTVSFNNEDGFFDDFKDKDIYGQTVTFLFGFGGYLYDDFLIVYVGYIEQPALSFTDFKLNLVDGRKYLSEKIPKNKVMLSEYPYLSDSDEGALIPIAYGKIRNAEPICLDTDQTVPSFFTFLFMDTEFHPAVSLDAVYITEDEEVTEVTPVSINLAAGTFQLAAIIAAPDGNLLKVTCDFHGANIKNGLAVARDIMLLYCNKPFTEDYYDSGEWADAEGPAADIGLLVDEATEVSELLGYISRDTDVCIFPTDDGRLSARRYNTNREIRKLIQSSEWLTDPEFEFPPDNYLSSCVVKYDKDRSSSDYRTYTEDDQKDEIYARYRVDKEEEIETNLTTEDDAKAKALTVMELCGGIPEIVSRSTKAQNMDIELMDLIIAEYERQEKFDLAENLKRWHIFEIIEVDKKILSGEVALKMRTIRDFPYPVVFFMYGMPLLGMRLMGHKLHGKLIYILDVV